MSIPLPPGARQKIQEELAQLSQEERAQLEKTMIDIFFKLCPHGKVIDANGNVLETKNKRRK